MCTCFVLRNDRRKTSTSSVSHHLELFMITLTFLDLNVNVDSAKKVTCGWYQKPTDTGTILNFRGCAPLQYKRNVFEGTFHRFFRSTSTWEYFDQALEKKIGNKGLKINIQKIGLTG